MKKLYFVFLHLLVLLLLCNFFFSTLSTLRRGLTFEVMNTLSACREQAKSGNAETAISCLHSAINYYPSGSNIEKGTYYDILVEKDRAFTIDYIIMLLKEKTGLDLGNDPNLWLSHFAK